MAHTVFEIKKILFYQKGIWFILLFILLKIVALTTTDDGADKRIEANKEQYLFYLEKVKGPLTKETESYLQGEAENIASAKRKIENLYTDYYFGVIRNEVTLSEEELTALAQEYEAQLENETGFNIIFEQYMYVREDPKLRHFVYTNGWNALLAHEQLDVFMFLLLLLLITPIFCHEYESKMDPILLSSKKGRVNLVMKKSSIALFFVTVLSLLFTVLEYTYLHLKYGFMNGHSPIQSIEFFYSSFKNTSLFGTFVLISIFKLLGYLCFTVLIMFVSVYTKKAILTLFICTSVILLPYFGLHGSTIKYLLPTPLGLMIGSGFIRGDVISESTGGFEPKVTFKAIADFELASIIIVLTIMTLVMCVLMIQKYINYQVIKKEVGVKQ